MIRVYLRHPWMSFRLWCRNRLDLWRDQRQATRWEDQVVTPATAGSAGQDRVTDSAAPRHRTVKVWTPDWYVRPIDAQKVACGAVEHHADTWFIDCEHTPQAWDYTESARALCDETGADGDILEAIAKVYFTSWSLHRRQGVNHVEQWPLALTVLAGLREAGFEVVRRAD